MLVLAVDTSGKQGSIALARCASAGICEVLEVTDLTGGTFSAQLIPQIAALLTAHGVNKRDVGAFAVISGPGSFTGLRVGLAAIKALGETLEIPIAAISMLELVARVSGGQCLAALDAGRGEIYASRFDGQQLHDQKLLTLAELLASGQALPIITPDTPVANALRGAQRTVNEIARPRADAVARLGWQKIEAKEFVSPSDLEANYIRRSDAEIFSAPR